MQKVVILVTSSILLFLACFIMPSILIAGATESDSEQFRQKAANILDSSMGSVKFVSGNRDAPIIMVEFRSQLCPWSTDFRLNVFPKLKEKYIDSGKIFFASIPYAHDDGDAYVMGLSLCSTNETFWPLVNELYEKRESYARVREKGREISSDNHEVVHQILGKYGIGPSERESCLADNSSKEFLIFARQLSNHLGAYGTPQYLINGKLYHELSWSDIEWLFGELSD